MLWVCRRRVLPPTCTKLYPSASWTSRAKSLFTLPKKKKGKGSKGKAAAKAPEGDVGESQGTNSSAAVDSKVDRKEQVNRQQVHTNFF